MEEVKGREREGKYMAWTDYVKCKYSALKTTVSTNMWE